MADLGNLKFNVGFKFDEKELAEIKAKALKQLQDIEVKINAGGSSGSGSFNTGRSRTQPDKATLGYIEQQINRLKELEAQYKSLAKGADATPIINEFREINVGLNEMGKNLTNASKKQDLAEGSLVSYRAQLSKLIYEYDRLSQAEREASTGKGLLENIQKTTIELNNAEQASMRYQRNVGNYRSGFNGLTFQVQQLARELPSIAYGANIFFAAISNNLPMFTDEVKNASEAYKKLKAEQAAGMNLNQKAIPVWRQLISGIFSWQTAIVAVVTILTLYGAKMIDAIGNMFNFGKATKLSREELKELNKTFTESVSKEMASLDSLFDKLNKAKEGTTDWYDARAQILNQHGDTLSAMNSEIATLNDKAGAYRALRNEIYQTAKAEAITKATQKARDKATETSVEEYNKIYQQAVDKFGTEYADKFIERVRKDVEITKKLSDELKNEISEKFTYTGQGNGKQIGGSITGYVQNENAPTNDIEKYIRNIITAQDDLIKKNEAAEKTYSWFKPDEKDIVRNKSYWENQLRAAQTEKDKMDESLINTDAYKNKLKEIEVIKAKIALWDEKEEKSGNKSNDRLKEQEEELRNYLDSVSKQVDEYAKQIDINTILGRPIAISLIDYIKSQMKTLGLDTGNADFLTTPFSDLIKNSSITDPQILGTLENFYNRARDLRLNDAKDEKQKLDDLLEKYATYEQQREKLEKDFAEERAKLEKIGDKEMLARADELNKRAVEGFNDSFFKDDSVLKNWVDNIANTSINTLLSLAAKLQGEMAKIQLLGGEKAMSSEEYNRKLQQLEAILKAIKEYQSKEDKSSDASYTKWKKLQSVLNKVDKSFKEIGDSIGGVAGEIINMAGNVTTATLSMIDSITTIAESSAAGISKTMSAMEKASVILTIMSAAFKTITAIRDTIMSLSSDGNYYKDLEAVYKSLSKTTDELIDKQLELIKVAQEAQIILASDEALRLANKQIEAARELGKAFLISGAGLMGAYSQVFKSFSKDLKALGIDYKKLVDDPRSLFDLSVKDLEKIKSSPVWKYLDEKMQSSINDIINGYTKIDDILKETQESITGTTKESIANSIVDGFMEGKKASKDFAENFEELMKDSIRNALSRYAEAEMQDFYDWFAKAGEGGYTKEEIEEARKRYKESVDAIVNQGNALAGATGINLGDTANKGGLSAGIKGITEDTANILSSYVNSMRADGAQQLDLLRNYFSDDVPQMNKLAQSQLNELKSISVNTNKNAEAAEEIKEMFSSVIAGTKSVKMK